MINSLEIRFFELVTWENEIYNVFEFQLNVQLTLGFFKSSLDDYECVSLADSCELVSYETRTIWCENIKREYE